MGHFELSPLFSDHWVMQRGRPNPLWGWDEPGAAVRLLVERGGKTVADVLSCAQKDGTFRVLCPALPPPGPYRIRVVGSGESTLEDVLVGEVWLALGQSNMQWPVSSSINADAVAAAANNPWIRTFKVPQRALRAPERRVTGQWSPATPETVGGFSAVGYFFARDLAERLDLPIGLVDATLGGSCIESWMSLSALSVVMPELPERLRELAEAKLELPRLRADYAAQLAAWERASFPPDPGNVGFAKGWASAKFDDSAWPSMLLPSFWQAHGMLHNGVVWFRREVTIPEAWAGSDLIVRLGAVDDYDHTYLDGVLIGSLPDGTPDAYRTPREYRVEASRVTAGRHVLSVRVFDHFGDGGFAGPAAAMQLLSLAPGGGQIAINGPWRYQVEHAIPLVAASVFSTCPLPPLALLEERAPAALYNGMLAPLVGLAVRGALWYQGESNTHAHACYRARLVAFIRDLRSRFGQGQFPFYLVQLANFRSTGDWAWLREAQQQATAEPATGMVVAVDIGESSNIHPSNKQEVGRRLSLLARAKDYGECDLVCESPTLERVSIEGGRVTVRFVGHRRLETSDGQDPLGFELAGADGVFFPAAARIIDDQVLLTSERVPEPHAVRYAWSDAPLVNLRDVHGLPVAPFRTDNEPV